MTEIRGNFPITINISLDLSNKKNHLGGWFWNCNFNFTRAVSGPLHLDLGLHRIWAWGKLGRERVYDRTGHTRPAFHFGGTVHELYT